MPPHAHSCAFRFMRDAPLLRAAGDHVPAALPRRLSHVLVKILAVFLCGTPVVWLMSLLYCSASGVDLPHGLFKVYGVLYRAPGASPPDPPVGPRQR